jgi:hypothetical protein
VHNGIDRVLTQAIEAGLIIGPVADQLWKPLTENFFAYVNSTFNGHVLPIITECTRVMITSKLPGHIDSLDNIIKGMRLEQSNNSVSDSAHVPYLIKLDELCKGIDLWENRRLSALQSLTNIAGDALCINADATFSHEPENCPPTLKALGDSIKEYATVINTLQLHAIEVVCEFSARAAPKRNDAVVKGLKLLPGLKGEPDASVAKAFRDSVLDYLIQDVEQNMQASKQANKQANEQVSKQTSKQACKQICEQASKHTPHVVDGASTTDRRSASDIYALCTTWSGSAVLEEGKLVTPPSTEIEHYGNMINLPPNFKVRCDGANKIFGRYLRSKYEELIRAARAGKKMDYGKGQTAFVIARIVVSDCRAGRDRCRSRSQSHMLSYSSFLIL